MAVGLGVYLLATTLVETVAGRSLGKLLTGLYVVGLDGKPAGIGARLLRNVLRIIDLPIMPLALILFSPLRQRAGDLAAGTLVVRGKADAGAHAPKAKTRRPREEGRGLAVTGPAIDARVTERATVSRSRWACPARPRRSKHSRAEVALRKRSG